MRRLSSFEFIALAALACLVWLPPSPGTAATFPGLYSVTVTAPEDGSAATSRADAIERGMAILLTRITGRREAGTYPELEPLLTGAESYLNSYAELEGERFRVGFNGARVMSALTSINWPLWGAERPSTLLWVAIDFGDGQRAIISGGDQVQVFDPVLDDLRASIQEEILQAADERGLPVVLPLLDAQDFQSISFAEIWGGFDPLIERASARYGTDATLVGRISITEFGLDTRWTLLQGGRSSLLRSSTLREGIDWVADLYAAEYSIVGGARMTRITIEGVDSLSTYGRVMSYLEGVSVLQTIDVEGVSGDVLTLRVAARGDDRVLERVLTLDGVLELAADDDPVFGFGAPLAFRARSSGSL